MRFCRCWIIIFVLMLFTGPAFAWVTPEFEPVWEENQKASEATQKDRSDQSRKRTVQEKSKTDGSSPGDTWTEPVTGMEFVWVEGGCYMMGSPLTGKPDQTSLEKKSLWYKTLAAVSCLLPVGCVSSSRSFYDIHGYDDDETPVHEVCVDGFWMGMYEVTIDQYRKFLQASGKTSGVDWDDDDCPVRKGGSYSLAGNKFSRSGRQPMVEVSRHGAKAFAAWLSDRTGETFRLPTEAEWEYAARSGGKEEKYAGSSNVDRVAWYRSNSGDRTHKVGTKAPNSLGLYDMSGNVWEWCEDVYDDDAYSKHSRNNPLFTSGGSRRVDRGGSWHDILGGVRAANRGWYPADIASGYVGFRLCLSRVR